MNKLILATTLVSALASLNIGHAGSVGPIASESISSWRPFATLEGSYTWNQFDGVAINHLSTSDTNQHWGGRFAAGIVHPISVTLRLSGELGGGYYGSTSPTIPADNLNARFSVDGYDFLVGAAYKINRFDLFGKVGLMVQNQRVKLSKNLEKTNPGGFISGTITRSYNQTQALPEVKVGGIYNLNDSWGISLAYMHVFGTNIHSNMTHSATVSGIITNGQSDTQNPTLNSVMLGLCYLFA